MIGRSLPRLPIHGVSLISHHEAPRSSVSVRYEMVVLMERDVTFHHAALVRRPRRLAGPLAEDAIESAVSNVLDGNICTLDIASDKSKAVSTKEMGDAIVDNISG